MGMFKFNFRNGSLYEQIWPIYPNAFGNVTKLI